MIGAASRAPPAVRHGAAGAAAPAAAATAAMAAADVAGAVWTDNGASVEAVLSRALLLLAPSDLLRAARVSRLWHAAAVRALWLVVRPASPARLHTLLLRTLRAAAVPLASSLSDSPLDRFACVKLLDLSRLHSQQAVTHANFVILINHCRSITSLNLSKCAWANDKVVAVIANAVSLEFLNLQGCTAVTGATLQSVLRSLPLLTRLSLAGCTGISSLQQVFDAPVSPLRSIDLREIFSLVDINATLSKIFSSFRKTLERIYIPGQFLSSDGFSCLVKVRPHVVLKSLFIESSPNLTDTSLNYLSRHAQHLESLSLSRAVCLTGPSIGAFVNHANLGRLSFVDFSHIPSIDDVAIKSLSSTTAVLQSLNLAGCVKITDESLNIIGHAFPCLHTLILAYTCVSANGIKTILQTIVSSHGLLLRLRKLSLSNCQLVLGTDVHNLARRCWEEDETLRETTLRLSSSSSSPGLRDTKPAASPISVVTNSVEVGGGISSPLSAGAKKSPSVINFGEIPLTMSGALPGMVLPPRRRLSMSESPNSVNVNSNSFGKPDIVFVAPATNTNSSHPANGVGGFLPNSRVLSPSSLSSSGSTNASTSTPSLATYPRISVSPLASGKDPIERHPSTRDSVSSMASSMRSPNIPTPPPRNSASSVASLLIHHPSPMPTPPPPRIPTPNTRPGRTESSASTESRSRTPANVAQSWMRGGGDGTSDRQGRSMSSSSFGRIAVVTAGSGAHASRAISRDRSSVFSFRSAGGGGSRAMSRDRGSIFSFASGRGAGGGDATAARVSLVVADGIKLEATWIEFSGATSIDRIREL
ncbi:hypothetical protein HDU83_008077 [Entophlyctis luteolus]|nr:hypothetical protein HDU83_008077 [Entophlyctis luteolus]